MFDTTLKLPGKFVAPQVPDFSTVQTRAACLSTYMQKMADLSIELDVCSYEFIHVDLVHKQLQQTHEGPFFLICRHHKTFKVYRLDQCDAVTVDCLKASTLMLAYCSTV